MQECGTECGTDCGTEINCHIDEFAVNYIYIYNLQQNIYIYIMCVCVSYIVLYVISGSSFASFLHHELIQK